MSLHSCGTDDCDDDEEFSTSRIKRIKTTRTDPSTILVGSSKSPVLRLQISNGALYACKWVDRSKQRTRQPSSNAATPIGTTRWLVVSGDDGVMILDWDTQILPLMEQNVSKQRTVSYSVKPKAHLKAFPSAFEKYIELNDFVISDNYLFGAAGDAFGCYKFDLETEKVVTNYREKGNTGYLQTVEILPGANHLLFGGEEGILSLFDTATDQPVDRFDMHTPRDGSGMQRRQFQKNSSVASSCWISSCCARDEHWWTAAGGYSKGGGFVATFHGPTRSVVSTAFTLEAPQQLAYYSVDHSSTNNKHSTDSSSKVLLSVANESYISHWNNPLSLCDEHSRQPERQRVYCSQPSAYAVSVSSGSTKRIAVGGVGSVVDIFEPKTQDSFQLSLY